LKNKRNKAKHDQKTQAVAILTELLQQQLRRGRLNIGPPNTKKPIASKTRHKK